MDSSILGSQPTRPSSWCPSPDGAVNVESAANLDALLSVFHQRDRLRLRARMHEKGVSDVVAQLVRVLGSRTFSRVQARLRSFLTFVVGLTLVGEQARIKQATVAMAVYGATGDFDPLETSVVRVAGRELRHRLDAYYRDEGRDDSIIIAMPVGTYVPSFVRRRTDVVVGPIHVVGTLPERVGTALARDVATLLASLGQFGDVSISSGPTRGWSPALRVCGVVLAYGDRLRLELVLFERASGEVIARHTLQSRGARLLTLPRRTVGAIVSALGRASGDGNSQARTSRNRSKSAALHR
jgi:hypothetical protein